MWRSKVEKTVLHAWWDSIFVTTQTSSLLVLVAGEIFIKYADEFFPFLFGREGSFDQKSAYLSIVWGDNRSEQHNVLHSEICGANKSKDGVFTQRQRTTYNVKQSKKPGNTGVFGMTAGFGDIDLLTWLRHFSIWTMCKTGSRLFWRIIVLSITRRSVSFQWHILCRIVSAFISSRTTAHRLTGALFLAWMPNNL